MIAYWISMYLVMFALVLKGLEWVFTKRGWTSRNAESTRIVLAFVWIFWLHAALLVAGGYVFYRILRFGCRVLFTGGQQLYKEIFA